MANIQRGTPWSQTGTSGTQIIITQTGVALKTVYITDITASSDMGTAVVIVKDGSTTIWQDRIGNAGAYMKQFVSPLSATMGNSVTVTVNGATVCYANASGYVINNS